MTLGEYIEQLQKFIEENPEAKDFTTVYAIDPEGNAFHEVYYEPGLGHFDPKNEEWESKENLNEENYDEEELKDKPLNSVCIN